MSRLDGFSGEFDRVGENSSNAVGRADADPSRVDECEVIDRENGLVGEVGVGAASQHRFHERVMFRDWSIGESVEAVADVCEPAAPE